jgi:hypothetical protein
MGTGAVGTEENHVKARIDLHLERLSIGAMADGPPFLTFRGSDGKSRVRLYLNLYDKPVLFMEDETRPDWLWVSARATRRVQKIMIGHWISTQRQQRLAWSQSVSGENLHSTISHRE